MELRAVSAQDTLTPLTVLVPILAMLAGTALAFTTFPPLALTICGGLAATAAAGSRAYGARTSFVAAARTLPAAFVAVLLWCWPGFCET